AGGRARRGPPRPPRRCSSAPAPAPGRRRARSALPRLAARRPPRARPGRSRPRCAGSAGWPRPSPTRRRPRRTTSLVGLCPIPSLLRGTDDGAEQGDGPLLGCDEGLPLLLGDVVVAQQVGEPVGRQRGDLGVEVVTGGG